VLGNHRYAPSTLLARELITSLLEANVAPARRITPTPATEAGRVTAERLIEAWDEDLAARSFAMNVELDEPLALRRAGLERLRERHGRLTPDPDPELAPESDTPLDLSWWLAGQRGGRVRVDILLTPQSPPLLQRFAVMSVAEPSPELRAVADAIVAALNEEPVAVPASIALGDEVDVAALRHALRVVAAAWAPLRLGPAVEGDGEKSACWRLRTAATGPVPTLELAVERRPEDGRFTALSVTQRPPRIPPFAD
jgi:hypothetical protein